GSRSEPALAARCRGATGTMELSAPFDDDEKQSDHYHPALLPPESRRILMATAEIISTKSQPMANWVRNANLLWDRRRLLATVTAVAFILSATLALITPKQYESV